MVKVELIVDGSREGKEAKKILDESGVPYVIPDAKIKKTVPHANYDRAYYGLDGIRECAKKYAAKQNTL